MDLTPTFDKEPEKIPMETIARITKVSVEQIRELGKLNGVL
ncbi:hypothetical protein [Acidaminococcus timonensis]|nr:hypothetical protein [Acidaminococcus timonensis]